MKGNKYILQPSSTTAILMRSNKNYILSSAASPKRKLINKVILIRSNFPRPPFRIFFEHQFINPSSNLQRTGNDNK